jgi:GNAT superfamily N-acetyltransferase
VPKPRDPSADVQTTPVGPAQLPDLARLFDTHNGTRGCWCTAYCVPRGDYQAGWHDGGNRRRFETMAITEHDPMGIIATLDREPVGWCACGPRARYAVATSPRTRIMRDRDPAEDADVWLLPCLFVRVGHRRQGITYDLVRAAVHLARAAGATAIEAWPLAGSERTGADAYLGRESLFENLGFSTIATPSPRRVVMRLNLTSAS